MNVQFAGRMGRDGMACTAEDVLILQGAQQGLDLTAKLLIDRGDIIITENPTFLGALIAFNPYDPRYATVRIDVKGISALGQLLKKPTPLDQHHLMRDKGNARHY